MAQILLNNCKLWVGKYDMSGKLNAMALNDAPDILINTTMGNTAKNRKQGLALVTASLAGFAEADSSDLYFSDKSFTNIPLTAAPEPTVGGPAYSFLSRNADYQWGGAVGELAKFSVKALSVGTKLIRGNILENGATARIANGNTATAIQLPAPSAGQYLYGVLHVISAATDVGDTLDVIIESDDVLNFGGTPETQLSFTQVLGNVVGGGTYQWATPVAAGAITDTYWRAKWTIVDAGADNASFTFTVFMGII